MKKLVKKIASAALALTVLSSGTLGLMKNEVKAAWCHKKGHYCNFIGLEWKTIGDSRHQYAHYRCPHGDYDGWTLVR